MLITKSSATLWATAFFSVPSQDGMITEERLGDILSSPKAVAYFQTLDVDVTESAALFSLLDNGDGEMSQEAFF